MRESGEEKTREGNVEGGRWDRMSERGRATHVTHRPPLKVKDGLTAKETRDWLVRLMSLVILLFAK